MKLALGKRLAAPCLPQWSCVYKMADSQWWCQQFGVWWGEVGGEFSQILYSRTAVSVFHLTWQRAKVVKWNFFVVVIVRTLKVCVWIAALGVCVWNR